MNKLSVEWKCSGSKERLILIKIFSHTRQMFPSQTNCCQRNKKNKKAKANQYLFVDKISRLFYRTRGTNLFVLFASMFK